MTSISMILVEQNVDFLRSLSDRIVILQKVEPFQRSRTQLRST
jgi:ABC-type branched-subunit amino acid transport system ATPase component